MNRIVSFAVIALLLIVSAGYFPVNQLQQYHVRMQVKQMLKEGFPEKRMEVILLSDTVNIVWEKKGREFWLDGKLYDIVRSEQNGNTIKYICYDDTREKALKIKLIKSARKQSESKNLPIHYGYNKLLDSLRQALTCASDLPGLFAIDAAHINFETSRGLYYIYPEIISPPPDLA